MEVTNCISVKNLSVSYQQQVALSPLSVDLPIGKISGIIGPNGSGKTTFLKAILGLIPAKKDSLSFFNQPFDSVRSQIAYVPQRESVDWNFPATVYDVVSMGRMNPKKWWQRLSPTDHSSIRNSLEAVDLVEFSKRQIGQLSGGQQQRVFLARALAQEANLFLMDEPFVGVDVTSQEAILKVLMQLRNEGKSIVIIHHDLSTVAKHFDYVVLLNNGLVACGETNTILQPEILAKAYGNSLFFNPLNA